MKRRQYRVILLAVAVMAVSCKETSPIDGFIDGKLQVYDEISKEVRKNEAVTLMFTSDSGEQYSSTRNTDDQGYIYFNGSPDGTYTAAFSYYPGTANDCFMEFSLASGERDFVMNVSPSVKELDTDIVITGYMPDVKGSDSGYEYMQFMALKDIDFTREHYCVIACRNNVVNRLGWVQGSYVTYKFNLTSGAAKKGEFFYVGYQKRLNGKNSADISGANWICSVDYTKQPGADNIGDKTSGYLHNGSEGKHTADGIAVFKGTEVTQETKPCDVIFYGEVINTDVYNPAVGGYLITDNDLYSTSNRLTGEGQKYFGMGNNTFLFDNPALDAGEFVALGGIFTPTGYTRGRSATYILCPTGADASIDLIEKNEGSTRFIEITE